LLSGKETVAEAESPPSPPAYLASVNIPAAYQGYPAPRYLPDGFKLLEVYTDRRDGFGRGSQELGYWFITSKFPAYPIAGLRPILVFVAKQPQLPWLWKTQGHSGQPRNLTLASGQTITAYYHDGHWVRDAWKLWEKPASALPAEDARTSRGGDVIVWYTADYHSLTFQHNGYAIGVSGHRTVGVGLSELAHVAGSIV